MRLGSKHTTAGVDDVKRAHLAYGKRLRKEVCALTTLRLTNDSVATSSANQRCAEAVKTLQSASVARSETDAWASRKPVLRVAQQRCSCCNAAHHATLRAKRPRHQATAQVVERLLEHAVPLGPFADLVDRVNDGRVVAVSEDLADVLKRVLGVFAK